MAAGQKATEPVTIHPPALISNRQHATRRFAIFHDKPIISGWRGTL
jgi:hypothetical protein